MITHPLAHHPGLLPSLSQTTMAIPTALSHHLASIHRRPFHEEAGSNEPRLLCCRLTMSNALALAHNARQGPLAEGPTMTASSPMLQRSPHALGRYKTVRLLSHHCLRQTVLIAIIGDDTYIVPEDVRAEAPPSYASAQADSVPPYWETTVHAPFSPDSVGEMIIDSLPTGSLFSFLWNMLVSISFQFVGFLLTYLLHTTHAARLGSRAGLGVTLIQYGFALRGRLEGNVEGDDAGWSEWTPGTPRPSLATAADADKYYNHHGGNNSTIPSPTTGLVDEQSNFAGGVTTEWLSFFLMTIGALTRYTSAHMTMTSTILSRMVHPPHIPSGLLAGQTLGTRNTLFPTRKHHHPGPTNSRPRCCLTV
jgi:hypothetical protein